MSITTVLFDLDGTLLPMDQTTFTKAYFGLLAAKLAPFGYPPETLIDSIWAGIASMVKNDGSQTNETAFWKTFVGIYGDRVMQDKPVFEEFYKVDFQQVQQSCGYTPAARETVDRIKAKGLRVALATNPIFPAVATESRIRWAGLDPQDFEVYTTYEHSCSCKPNPAYYREVSEQLGVAPENCLMVGNDATEDLAAASMGMRVFLLTDCLINKESKDLSAYPCGGFDDLLAYINTLI